MIRSSRLLRFLPALTLLAVSCLPSLESAENETVSSYLMANACAHITALQSTDFCATAPKYTVGGTVTGLSGTGLTLQLGSELLSISADGAFQFTQLRAAGQAYNVTVAAHPTGPTQLCTVVGGSGTIVSGNVTTVAVNCSTGYLVGGTVTGLAGTGLSIRNNGSNTTSITANGGYAFSTPLSNGATYSVTINAQPVSPAQTCSVSGGSGTIAGADVTTANINCITNTYAINVATTGLIAGTLQLQDSISSQNLSVTANGTTSFATPVASGSNYNVTITAQPAGQTCTLSAASGTIGAAAVTVTANCTPNTYTISGSITTLSGSGAQLQLQNTGGTPFANQTINVASGQTSFSFSPVPDLADYAVVVLTQPGTPVWQTCAMGGPDTGTLAGANITTVSVTCTTNEYQISGSISGYSGTGLVLRLNGLPQINTDLAIADGATAFDFATDTVRSGETFTVSVATQPDTPTQTCAVTGSPGTVTNANITTVVVNCTTNSYTIGGTLSGAMGGITLTETVSGQTLNLAANGSFTFASPVLSGAAYNVTVTTQPVGQTCIVGSGAGTVAGAAVTSVVVNCNPMVTATTPTNTATNESNSQSIQVTFNNVMDPATITTNAATDLCTGTVQVSFNNFLTCAPLGAVTTGDNRTFSIALPGINLFAGTQYRIRVLGTATGVKDANSLTMAADFTQATGFTTSGPVRRYSFTASSLDHRSDPDNATGLFVLAGSSTTTRGHDGDNNGGRRFDGSTTTLDGGAGSATGLPSGNSPRTMCSWMALDTLPAISNYFIGAHYGPLSDGQAFFLGVSNEGTIALRGSGWAVGYHVDQATPLTLNAWFHACATYDGTSIALYHNGRLVGSGAVALNTNTATGTMRIGSAGISGFPGRIDDVRIYDSVLPPAQIRQLASQIRPGLSVLADLNGDAKETTGLAAAGSFFGGTVLTADRWGLANQAVEFDGVSRYVQFAAATTPSLPTGSANRTVCAWVRPRSLPIGSSQAVIGWGGAAAGQASTLALRHDGATHSIEFTNDPAGGTIKAAFRLPLHTWSHLCGVYSSGTAEGRLFLNGQQIDIQIGLPAWNTAASDLYVGRSPAGGDLFDGAIDDVRIYNRPLTLNEIRALSGYHVQQIASLRFHGIGDTIDPSVPDGTTIAAWPDASGYDNDLTSPQPPTKAALLLNEHRLFKFAGGEHFMTTTANDLTSQTQFTMYLVMHPAITPPSRSVLMHAGRFDTGGARQFAWLSTLGGRLQLAKYTGAPNDILTNGWVPPLGEFNIYATGYDGTLAYIWKSPTASNATVGGFSFSTDNELYIGINPNDATEAFEGFIAEALYFNGVEDQNVTRCYLSARYAIAVGNICN